MNRILLGYEQIGRALDRLPVGMRARLHGVEFLTGTNPEWAGLLEAGVWWKRHPYQDGQVVLACCYPWHTRDRSLTIVLMKPVYAWQIVHEIGHALSMREGLREYQAEPVTDYATHSRHEAFAEALVARLYHYGHPEPIYRDRRTAALLDRLSEAPV